MNMLFLPVTNCLLLVTSILFSPLMPLFSLPIFMMAFPRPRRFWPHSNNEEIKQCNDAVLYEQVIPQVSQELFLAERKGRLGHLVAGDFLLLRFGDRMLWLYVMESGNDYYVYQMKGLELQETSCHTIEANRIDEIFNSVFNNESSESCLFNPFWFHCLTPLCQITVNSYSDAKNVLTGVIDNPMLVKLVGQLFPKCLVWVIANHSLDIKLKAKMKASVDKSHVVSPVRKRSRPDSSQLLRALPKYKPDEVFLEQSLAADSQIDNVCQINPIVDSPRPSSSSSVIKMNKKAWTNSDLFDATAHTSIIRVEPAKGAIKSSSISSLDSWLEELDGENLSPSSSPRAVQLVAGKERTVPGFLMDSFAPESVIPNNRSPIPVKTKLPALPVFSSNYAMSLAPPVSWYEIPCEFSVIRDRRLFPVDWFHFIIENLFTKYLSISKENHFEKKKNSKELSETLNDEALETVYRKIVVVCVLAINRSLEEGDAFNGARHIHNVFNGDIPWSLKSEWLAGKPELQELVIRAYRYAVKMAIDMVLLGEVSENFPDIVDYLEDFDLNWLMGSHTDESWKESILKEKPTLFSIGYNEMREVFTSHLLTLQPTQINVAYLNGELIRGLWSSLSFELLYLTNDDEERYSIQAHPTILRNLTVQAADPPLGYPIYISEPIFKSVRSWSDLY